MKNLFTLYFLLMLAIIVRPQVPQLWGITGLSGTNNKGTLFNLPGNGSSFTTDFNFGALSNAAFPQSTKLCQAGNGLLYGVTSAGGATNDGLIFTFNPKTRVFTDVFEFNFTDGSDCWGTLIQASDGLLYGTTSNGGTNGSGVIFSFDPSTNLENVLYNFGTSGANPQGSLVQANNGKLYGMTELGGSPGFQGHIFAFDPTVAGPSAYQDIYAFPNVPTSVMAVGTLIQGVDGLLYGMTEFGGTNQDGNVFSIDTLGANYSDLVDFDGTNGENPFGDLIQAKDGKLYGMTPAGGAFTFGNIFYYDPGTSTFHDIIDLNSATGDSPYGNLLQASDGNLYGMTFADGSGGAGSIFSIVPGANTFTPLFFFNSANSGTPYGGANPTGSLMQASNGLLYGMTFDGGFPQSGNLFSFDINPSNPLPYFDYVDFESTTQGAIPYSFGYVQTDNGIVQGSDGMIYGMTFSGGTGADQWSTYGGDGTLYSFNPTTGAYKELYDFIATATPYGTPLMASDGKLYGLAFDDGANLAGTIFSLDTFGNYTDLFDFVSSSDALGQSPYGGFAQASNGLLYGMTSVGGAGGSGSGVIFSFDPAHPSNAPVPLYTFTGGTDGGTPYYGASLIQAKNGLLYGTTLMGGSGATPGCTCGNGVIFSFDPNPLNPHPENVIWAFDGITSGLPAGSLVQANNGLLYGMGSFVGANSGGTLFSVDTLGTSPKVLVNFDSNGDNPVGGQNGSLWQASDGKIYGGTESGGTGSAGTLFSFDTTLAVNYTTIHNLNGTTDGSTALGSPIELRNISTSAIGGSPLCTGANVNVPFVAGGYYTYANVFTAQLSDASGNFSSPVNIGTLSGTTGGTIHATIPGGTSTGAGYRIRVVSSSPVITGVDNGSNISVSSCATVNIWLGHTNDWNATANWSLGTVPLCADIKDSIPVTSNDPVVSIAENASNLVIDDNVTLTVNAALSVCGNLTGGSTRFAVIQGSTALTLTGTALQTLSGLLSFQNQLSLDNTSGGGTQVQLASGAAIDIYDALVLQNSNKLNTSQGTLTLKSASVTQAGIIDNFSGSNSGSITGNIIAERFYAAPTTTNSYNQHEMGSPVNSPALSQFGASGTPGYVTDADCDGTKLDISSPYGTVFGYDETHGAACGIQQWKVLTGGNAVNGVGYSIRSGGPGTLSLTGAPNISGNVTVSGTNSGWTNSTLQGYPEQSGWTLASNPYPATLHISAGSLSNNVDAGWDGVGVMVWNTTGGSAGSYQLTTTLAPFQAFMVHITEPGTQSSPTSATYTIYATDRATSTTTFYKEAIVSTLNITATNQSSGLIDLTTVGFNQNATSSFDPSFDMHKIAGDPDRHTLYTLSNGNWMCQNINQSISETPTVPVGFSPGVSGTYSLHFDGVNSFDATSYITLEDTKLNIFHDVRSGDYVFTADVNDGWNRFVLHFTPPASINTTNATCSEQGMINIVQPGTAVWNYTLADNNNAILSTGALNVSSPVNANVVAGMYTLTLLDDNGYTVVKTIQVNGARQVVASFTTSTNAIEANRELTLSSTSTDAVLCSWNFGDGITGSGATVSHTYTSGGIYNIIMEAMGPTGCFSFASNTITVTRSTTGVTGLNDINSILIWSNGDIVNVDFTQLSEVQANIEIYNILGQKLSEDKYVTSAVYHKEIPNIEEGYIVVSVKNNDEIITRKLFISNVK